MKFSVLSLLVVLTISCVVVTRHKKISTPLPPMPVLVAARSHAPLVVVVPPKPLQQIRLCWNYPSNSLIVFNVFSSPNPAATLSSFQWKLTTALTTAVFNISIPHEFFIVSASNTITHEVSNFATQ